MDKIRIEGVPPWDGDYDFDPSFKNRELNRIKNITGIRGGEIAEALAAGDTDLMVALAVLALERQGKSVDPDDFWNAEVGAITYIGEDDAGPPADSSQSESDSETSAEAA